MTSSKQILNFYQCNFFSLKIRYYLGVSFVLISCFFPEQYLFENFVPIFERLCNAYAKASCGVLGHDQTAIPTNKLLTVSNLFRAANNEINFFQKIL